MRQFLLNRKYRITALNPASGWYSHADKIVGQLFIPHENIEPLCLPNTPRPTQYEGVVRGALLSGPLANQEVTLFGVSGKCLKKTAPPCRCKAYAFPHKPGTGHCSVVVGETYLCSECHMPAEFQHFKPDGPGGNLFNDVYGSVCCHGEPLDPITLHTLPDGKKPNYWRY